MTTETTPLRVVSLFPAATEIVAALGCRDSLVGVSHECDFPASVGGLPRVTASRVRTSSTPGAIDAAVRELAGAGAPLYDLDEPAIAALHPDLVITQGVCEVCAVSEHDVRALVARLNPAPAVVSLDANTFDAVLGDIQTVAAALAVPHRGSELVHALHRRLESVHLTLKAARAPRPRVAVVEWTDPLFAAGHWTPELVRRAGGVDVLAEPGVHSIQIALERIRDSAPDIILVAPCGYAVDGAEQQARALLEQPGWEWARGREVWALDANALTSRPGPRLVDAVETMAAVFAPSLFPPPNHGVARLVARPPAALPS